jgi:hypothetical protein
MVAECNEFHYKAREFKMFGFVVQGHGFYSIKVPGGDEIQKAAAIIQVLQGDASEKRSRRNSRT